MISSDVLISLFQALRGKTVALGVRELLDAVRLAEDRAMTPDAAALRRHLRLLWCYSHAEKSAFDALWAELPLEPPERAAAVSAERRATPTRSPAAPPTPPDVAPSASNWSVAPIHAPQLPCDHAPAEALRAAWPVSRRQMLYGWRRLQRLRPDGVLTVFDLQATIERIARAGFLTHLAYRRQLRNHARLLLMIDQNGSMTPLHRFARDLAATAARHAETARIGVEIVYFHNIPNQYLYQDPHLTLPESLDEVCARCTRDTSILIVSDAGAARGFRHLPRIQETIKALVHLKQTTTLLAWLNPMPEKRWAGSSAQMLAALVPMHSLHWDGFSRAIDAVRGQRA